MSEVINPYWGRRRARTWQLSRKARVRTGSVRLSTAIYTVVAVVLVAACFTYHRQTRSELEIASAKYQSEAALVGKLTVQSERLKVEIQEIKTDPRMIESVARDLGFVKPGDVVIKIIPPGQTESSPSQSNTGSRTASSQQR